MEIDKIYEIMDIDNPNEFKYFENLAALAESEEDIGFEEMFYLFEKSDLETVSGLFDDYFEDISNGVPDTEEELFILFENIKRVFTGLCLNNEDENHIVLLCEEMIRFRNWYNFDTDVICKDNSDGKTKILRVKDALFLYRTEKFDGKSYNYDFSESLNYEIPEYIVSLTDNDNDFYDYTSEREEEALLESDFLFDDEYSEE